MSTVRRRILVLCPFAPRRDARHGGRLTTGLLLRLAERHEVALAFVRRPGEQTVDPELAARCARVEALAVPQARRLPGLRRRARLAAGLARGRPMWASELWWPPAQARVAALLEEWRPDVVHVELRVTGMLLPAGRGHRAPRVLVDHDPPAAGARDLARLSRGPERLLHTLDARAWALLERRTSARIDAVVTLTERDRRVVAASFAGPVVQIPPGLDLPPAPLDPLGVEPPEILFVGGFGHLPNVDAAVRLAGQVLPRVRARRPDATLLIVGAAPPGRVRALASPAVAVLGEVPDVGVHLARAAVVLAPIRAGGGVRVKLLEALAAGKASVTTPRGADGLEGAVGHALLVADGDQELADAVTALLDDPGRRAALGGAARRWAAEALDWDIAVSRFEGLYDELLGG